MPIDARLLSLLGHELRAPVGVIGGYLALLERRDEGLTPPQQRALEGARRAQQVAVEILEDVSRLAAVEAVPVRTADVSIGAVLAAMQATAHAREVTVVLQDGASEGQLRCDRDATPAALAAVATAIAREHGAPVACVVDAGPGVITIRLTVDSAATVDLTPQPFNELRAGLGLRLVVAYAHMRRLGGDVAELASGGRSYGAVIQLPRVEHAEPGSH